VYHVYVSVIAVVFCSYQRCVPTLLQLSQTALVQQRQIAVDLTNIHRQLNTSDSDIVGISTGISDVRAEASQIMTSAQTVQANVTALTSDAVDLSAATDRVTQLESVASNVDSQVHTN